MFLNKTRHAFFCISRNSLTMLLKNNNIAKRIPSDLTTIEELLIHLSKLNNSIMVYVKEIYINTINGSKIYKMSNGNSYTKNKNKEWVVV
jgi:hypothetical protein